MLQTIEVLPAIGRALDEVALAAGASLLEREVSVRLWVSGTVALEPRESAMQMQRFANWAQSDLTWDEGIGDTPPAGYRGVRYVPIGRHRDYDVSPYEDYLK
jgi:hypothetical protein